MNNYSTAQMLSPQCLVKDVASNITLNDSLNLSSNSNKNLLKHYCTKSQLQSALTKLLNPTKALLSTIIIIGATACGGGGIGDTPAPVLAPNTPTELVAIADSDIQITLKWKAGSGGNYYEIYRSASASITTKTKLDTSLTSTSSSFVDKDLTANTKYYYWLKYCRTDNTCSDFSKVINAITALGTPTKLTATADSTSQITLKWDVAPGGDYYEIYRSASASITTKTKLDTSLTSTSSSFVDKDLTANTKYYYWLKYCRTDNTCSGYSDAISLTTKPKPTITADKLNDTGITWGGNYPSGNNSTCIGETSSAQDCKHGRDAKDTAGTLTKVGAGMAGFDFTKLGATGTVLKVQDATWSDSGNETDGTKWSCVRDNYTGLTWEVKTNDGTIPTDKNTNSDNIHHKMNRYLWGGKTAIGKNSGDIGSYFDSWDSLVNGSNSEKLCGFSDWRVPGIEDLKSIVHLGTVKPTIDTNYFPNTGMLIIGRLSLGLMILTMRGI